MSKTTNGSNPMHPGVRGVREETRDETGRNTRVPLGVHRSKMAVPEIPGYKCRWMNDLQGRIQQALAGGYEFVAVGEVPEFGDYDVDNVNRDLGAKVSRVVDKATGQKAILMKIRKEFWLEDQAAKQANIDVIDRAIKEGKLKDSEHRYVPDNGRGIKIEQS